MSFQKKKDLVILGIDPGIADTGYGLIKEKNGKLVCLEYGSIKTEAKLKLPERINILYDKLNLILERYSPDYSGVEELFFCNNVKTALIVGQARGAVLLSLTKNKIPIFEFTPLQVKQSVTSYGKAPKRQVQEMVKTFLNLKEIPRPDDAADALAVAICTHSNLGLAKYK